jgi:hypothetical protein
MEDGVAARQLTDPGRIVALPQVATLAEKTSKRDSHIYGRLSPAFHTRSSRGVPNGAHHGQPRQPHCTAPAGATGRGFRAVLAEDNQDFDIINSKTRDSSKRFWTSQFWPKTPIARFLMESFPPFEPSLSLSRSFENIHQLRMLSLQRLGLTAQLAPPLPSRCPCTPRGGKIRLRLLQIVPPARAAPRLAPPPGT